MSDTSLPPEYPPFRLRGIDFKPMCTRRPIGVDPADVHPSQRFRFCKFITKSPVVTFREYQRAVRYLSRGCVDGQSLARSRI